MKHELELFLRDIPVVMDQARRLISGLPADQVNQRPAAGEWSVAECLDHLTASAQVYHPMVDDAIARGTPLGPQDYHPGWIW